MFYIYCTIIISLCEQSCWGRRHLRFERGHCEKSLHIQAPPIYQLPQPSLRRIGQWTEIARMGRVFTHFHFAAAHTLLPTPWCLPQPELGASLETTATSTYGLFFTMCRKPCMPSFCCLLCWMASVVSYLIRTVNFCQDFVLGSTSLMNINCIRDINHPICLLLISPSWRSKESILY